MKRIMIILPMVVLCMIACGIYSTYKPANEVPEGVYGAIVTDTTDTITLGGIAWKELFTDPHLQTYIYKALKQNTDYLNAQLRVEQAEATLLSAKLAYLPSFALAPQGGMSTVLGAGSTPTWTYDIPITASWQIDIFGSVRNNKRQANALYAQSKDYQQAVRTQLIAGVANIYYTLLMLDEQLRLTQESEKAWEETVRAAQALMNAGHYNEAAVAQMKATYYGVQSSTLALQEQINQVENSLSLLLAEAPRTHERSTFATLHSGSSAIVALPKQYSVGVPLQMLSARPDVRSAERSLEAAFYGTNAARSAFYPKITLGGTIGWTNAVGALIVDPAQWLVSAVMSLVQPLFQNGQLVGQLKIARANQEMAANTFQQTLLKAGVEVNDALTAWQTAHKQNTIIDSQVEELQNAFRSTTLLMEYGNTTYLEVLNAHQTLLSAQLSQTATRFAEVQSVITLYQALGGGQE